MQIPLVAGLLGASSIHNALKPALLTPEKLISAPRPGAAVVNPSGSRALVGVKAYSFDKDKWDETLYHIDIPSNVDEIRRAEEATSDPLAITKGASKGFWLSDDVAAYINATSNTLYAKQITESDSKSVWTEIGSFPTAVETIQVARAEDGAATSLVFSAQVYGDGNIHAVKSHEESEKVKEWKRVKVYDSTFIRHWDTWLYPGKRSQLFAVDVKKGKSGADSWALDGHIRNLMNGTTLEAPVPPFGDEGDYAVSATHVAFTSKDPDLSPSWHTKQNIYVVPLSGDEKPVQVTKGQHGATSSPTFSHDGKKIAWLQMDRDGYESDRRKIRVASLEGDSFDQAGLLEDWTLSPSAIRFSPDDASLIGIVEDAEQDVIFEADLAKKKSKDATPGRITYRGGATSLQGTKGGVLVSASTIRGPTDLYLVSPHASHNAQLETRAVRLTNFGQMQGSSLQGVDLGKEAEQFSFPGSKGRTSHGWIHYPPGYEPSKTYALAVLIHGGPEGAWVNSWSTRWNPEVFSAQGLFVITIDPAGSSGFGQAYQEEILNNWGGAPFEDIRAGTKHILKRFSNIDPERVVAAGASYGGYMINWINGHNEDKLYKGLVCHDGVFSTLSTFYSTEELYFPEFEFGGVPWKHREGYEKWSPERFTDKWETPQLTIAGGLDFRLPTSEGISVFNTLQRRGVPSRLIYFEEENHWVLNPKNSLKWHEEVLGWLLKYSSPSE